MKKLQPVLDLINKILIQSIQVQLASVSEDALGVSTQVSKISLSAAEAEGLTLEEIRFNVESVKLPSPDNLNLEATLFLDHLDLHIAPPFWPRAAKVAKNPLVAKLGILVDRVEVSGVRIQVSLTPAKVVSLRVTMDLCRVTLMGQAMQEVENLDLEIQGLDLKEKDKKKALKASSIRLQNVQVKVYELTMNRAFDVIRDKLPSKAKLNSLDIALIENTMRLTIKTGYFPMSVPIELQMSTQNNLFGIYIVKVFIGLARPFILKAVQTFAASKPEVSASGDNIWIDPWVKIPLPIEARVETFVVRSGALVIGFGSLPQKPVAELPPVQAETEERPSEEESQEAEEPLTVSFE